MSQSEKITRRGAAGGTRTQLIDLPFVVDRKAAGLPAGRFPRCFWHVQPTGDYAEDCRIGGRRPLPERGRMMAPLDWNAIQARLEVIADALGLPYSEVELVMRSRDAAEPPDIVDFADRHNQSLDWIFLGDVRPMIRAAARQPCA